MSRFWKLDSLLRQMENNKHYDNKIKPEDVKSGDSFWLVGYNMPLDFIEMKDGKIIFDGHLGNIIEYTVEQFKRLIPCK